jgi:hypothetical protein
MMDFTTFKDQLMVVSIDERRWKLLHEFHYKHLTVPKGFITDFASTPQLFWNILPPWGRYGKAAVIHDYLYQNAGRIDHKIYTRKYADVMFRNAMKELGVKRWKRFVMYWGVRLGGWKPWNNYERNLKNE